MVGLFVCYAVCLIVLVRVGGYLLGLNCCFSFYWLFGMLFLFGLRFCLLAALIVDLLCLGFCGYGSALFLVCMIVWFAVRR